ncbi:hypothetical protein GCM10009808_20480 [Microbacterium sediminicola]|uniref:SbsA Ig-like domain-containing protein n=1 Tax=Microbacterium sediminicola TaxID=415210 RepID=A0ABP4UEW8_9MICO
MRRRLRAYLLGFGAVIAALAIVGGLAAAVSVAVGPRVTNVHVDPAAAIAASGARLIITTSQSLAEVDADQVTVTPATPFQVDTAGRTLGIRFTVPLDDSTEYTVSIAGVTGVSGDVATTITETFTTPASEIFLLQRGTAEGDTIFRTDLTGEQAVAVFAADHIEDFRATAEHLVVWIDDAGTSSLIVTDLDGNDPQELPLPAEGYLSGLQSADRGEQIGYLFTDADPSVEGALESALFTTSLNDPAAEPTRVAVAGVDERIAQWSFVPDTDSILLMTFDGALMLTQADGADPTAFGSALAIDGIAAGTSEAIIERLDGIYVLDLATGDESVLVPADTEGLEGAVLPIPGGETVRTLYPVTAEGYPTGATEVAVVTAEGTATVVYSAPATDALLQTCVSPSGQYVAVLVAPGVADNPYDGYQLPLPETVETHIIEVSPEGGVAQEVVALTGFAISWCQTSVAWR